MSRLAPDDRVVVIGGGQAGVQSAVSLREAGFPGKITIVADEPGDPYQRPPLSKTYIHSPSAPALPLRTLVALQKRDIEVVHGRAVRIDRAAQTVVLESVIEVHYDHLILATGARNRQIPISGSDAQGVLGLRTLKDAGDLREVLAEPRQVIVIGGGFIGMEFAASAAMTGHTVTVLEAGDRVMARAASPELSQWVTSLHERHGNRIVCGATLLGVSSRNGVVDGADTNLGLIPADVVLMAVGVQPNVELAADAGLEVGNGIVVDEYLATSDPRISGIGDSVEFPNLHAGVRTRLESVQNATDQAKYVAHRLLSDVADGYRAAPWFWTHQFDANIQMIGVATGGEESMIVGDPSADSFSILRVQDGRVKAVESINESARHMLARKVFANKTAATVADFELDALKEPATG